MGMISNMSDLSASTGPLLGLILIFGSLLCLGTFPTVLRLCTVYTGMDAGAFPNGGKMKEQQEMTPKERFGQGRHPCHVCLDFTVSYVALTAVVFPAISSLFYANGSNNQLQQAEASTLWIMTYVTAMWKDLPLIAIVMLAGSLLALGNLSQQWSTAAFHAPLTTVLAIQASLCVIVGTYWNYTLQPSRTSRPKILLVGVTMFLAAIVCSLYAQSIYQMEQGASTKTDEERKKEDAIEHGLQGQDEETTASSVVGIMNRTDSRGLSLRDFTTRSPIIGSRSTGRLSSYGSSNESAAASQEETSTLSNDTVTVLEHLCILEAGTDLPSGASESTQRTLMSSDCKNISPSDNKNSKIGIVIAALGGLAFGFFSPMFNIAVNNPFQWSTAGGGSGLSLSTANTWFAIGFAVTSLSCNTYLMTYPPTLSNETTPLVHQSSLAKYLSLSAESMQERGLAFLAGGLCALTNVLQFEGGALAGFAAADMTKAFPLVATVWDIFVFGEFQNASRRVVVFLVFMYISYTLGMACLAGSIAIE